MVPVSAGDIVWGVAAAQRLYGIGFRRVSNASQKYRDFGEDIRLLAINLDLISDVILRVRTQDATFYGLGNFRETLNDCERLLDDYRYFTKLDGFVYNVSFYYQIDPEVQKLRDRIALHNIKLAASLKILDPLVPHLLCGLRPLDTNCSSQILGDRFIQICDPTNAILSALENLGQQFRGEEERGDLPNEQPGPVAIPQELEEGLFTFAQEIFPDLSSIPLDRGVDTAIFYFNLVTKPSDQLVQTQIKYLTTIINIMKAAWLLRTVKAGQYYQIATRYCSPNSVEEQMGRWGMTIDRFFNKFEENLHEAFRNLLGRHLLLPPTPDLLVIFDKETRRWQGGSVSTPKQETEPAELGTRVIGAHLRSSDPGYTQTLQVYRQTEKRFSLLLAKAAVSEGRDKETIDSFNLEDVQIVPSYAVRTWTSPPSEPQTIRFRTNSHSPFYRNLAFHQNKDMFEFQQMITGYKVVLDDARVLATSQESRLLGGTRRQDLCRLQIWTASPSKAEAPTSIASIGSPRPSFARIATMPPRRKSSVFSLSTASSGLKRSTNSTSSSPSRSSFTTDSRVPTNFVVPVGGTAVYTPPVAPCIVLFTHKFPERGEGGEGEEGERSFLIIDVNPEVIIDEGLIENDLTNAPSFRCVLESKGSYLPARRSSETSDPDKWDLAVAGLHKREGGTETVKRLKHVITQFGSQNNLSEFTTKFKQVQDLAKLRLSQFLQETGQG